MSARVSRETHKS